MLLIQQILQKLNCLTESYNATVTHVRNLLVSDKNQENALCNHAAAINSLRADVVALDAKIVYEEEEDPEQVVTPIAFLTNTTVIPNNVSSFSILLPLSIEIISIMIQNTTVFPTEELGYSNYSLSSDQSNTILRIYLRGISNRDTFSIITKYIQIPTQS